MDRFKIGKRSTRKCILCKFVYEVNIGTDNLFFSPWHISKGCLPYRSTNQQCYLSLLDIYLNGPNSLNQDNLKMLTNNKKYVNMSITYNM